MLGVSYSVSLARSVVKQLKRLDKADRARVLAALDEISALDDPRSRGKALTGQWRTYWRYRVGNYRVICEINDASVTIVAVRLGHRSTIYRH